MGCISVASGRNLSPAREKGSHRALSPPGGDCAPSVRAVEADVTGGAVTGGRREISPDGPPARVDRPVLRPEIALQIAPCMGAATWSSWQDLAWMVLLGP